MAQTPMKEIIFKGLQIYSVDQGNVVELICLAASPEQRDWLIGSLATFHKVPARAVPMILADGRRMGHG